MSNSGSTTKKEENRKSRNQCGKEDKPEQVIAYLAIAVLSVVIMRYFMQLLPPVLRIDSYLGLVYPVVWATVIIIIFSGIMYIIWHFIACYKTAKK
jgi:uncharacterized protein YqhQ